MGGRCGVELDDLRGGRWKEEKGVVSLGGVCCVKMKSRKGEGWQGMIRCLGFLLARAFGI